jgi:hypothetical protein
MPYIYICSLWDEYGANALGTSPPFNADALGLDAYAVIALVPSSNPHLRIYRGLKEALEDISASTSVKGRMVFPFPTYNLMKRFRLFTGEACPESYLEEYGKEVEHLEETVRTQRLLLLSRDAYIGMQTIALLDLLRHRLSASIQLSETLVAVEFGWQSDVCGGDCTHPYLMI